MSTSTIYDAMGKTNYSMCQPLLQVEITRTMTNQLCQSRQTVVHCFNYWYICGLLVWQRTLKRILIRWSSHHSF